MQHPGVFPGPDQVYLSGFVAQDRPQTQTQIATWDQVVEVLSQHTITPNKRDVGLFNFCRFSTPYRKDANVVDVSALLLDIDDEPLDVVQALAAKLADYAHVGYSTHRHGETPGAYRLRIVVRLSRPVLHDEWPSFVSGIRSWLGDGLDKCVAARSQSYFLPSCPPERASERLTFAATGKPIDVQLLLATAPEVPVVESTCAETWRPEVVVTRAQLAQLPGETARRVLAGGELAPEHQRHHARRNLVFQFLTEFGPCEPDADLYQLLVGSAQASRETWVQEFTSSRARQRAEDAYVAERARRDADAAQAEAWTQLATESTASALAQASASAQTVIAQANDAFTPSLVRAIAKKCRNETTKAVLLAACSGSGVPDDLLPALQEAGRYLGYKEAGRDIGVIKRAFVSQLQGEQLATMYAGIDLGAAQARNKENWRKGLSMADEKIVPHEKNVRVILAQHEKVAGKLTYDVRSAKVRVGDVPWSRGAQDAFWSQSDAGGAMEWVSNLIGAPVSSRQVDEALNGLSESLPNYDPVQVYLTNLPAWDGVPRLSRWLEVYAGAPDDSYTRTVARACLIASVARTMRPGCKVDQVPVLEGEEGVRKTTLLRALCPDEALFMTAEGALNLDNVKLVHKLQNSWIVEMGELSSLRQGDQESAKAFLSEQVDSYRAPYGRHVLTRPRRFVFFGTTNRRDYLRSEYGNRRFLPVPTSICRPDLLRTDRDQLWAEALAAYEGGEQWWVEGTDEVRAVQASRVECDPLEGQVIDCAEHFVECCYEQVLAWLGVPTDRAITHRLRKILVGAGYVQGEKQRREILIPGGPGATVGKLKTTNDRFWVHTSKR